MKGLPVDGVDRHLRAAKETWIVERAGLQNYGGKTRSPSGQMRAAIGAEFPRHGAFKIAARELLWRPSL